MGRNKKMDKPGDKVDKSETDDLLEVNQDEKGQASHN